jgi:hypothetical protein
MSRPGSIYTRCRVAARTGGCSLLTRRPMRQRLPSPPGSRSLAPDSLLSGAGGGVVAV